METAGLDYSFVDLNPESRILDVGCGRGNILIPLWRMGLFAVGVDPEIGYLTELLSNSRLPLEIRGFVAAAQGEKLPFRSNAFDILVCREVLEHVANPKLLLREISRVLKPDGYLILTVPYNITERLLSFLNPRWLSICGHRSVFSIRHLSEMLQYLGFRLTCISKENFCYTYFWFFHCIFRTRHDGTGRPLENEWLSEYLQCTWNRLMKIRGGWKLTQLGRALLPKSIHFYCRKI